METRRGKGLSYRGSSATSRVSSLGKENICPSFISREPVGASRSPLPEGFPRAPLQDITHILSPINILPDDGGSAELGPCRPCRKRSKCVGESPAETTITRCDLTLDLSETKWSSGLRKCVSVQAAVRDLHVKAELKPTEAAESQALLNSTETAEVKDAETLSEVQNVVEGALKIETRDTEQFVCKEIVSMGDRGLKAGFSESSPMIRSRKAVPGKPHKLISPSPVTRAGIRSAQQKPKMSSIMKLR